MSIKFRLVRAGLVLPVVMLAAQVGLTGVAHAGVHVFYVAPNGTGTDCTTGSPCDFMTAYGQLVGDDVIVMASGTYPQTGTYSTSIAPPTNVTITGTPGQTPPVINSSNAYPFSLGADDRLSWVVAQGYDATQVIYAASATIDHVTAIGGGSGAQGVCVLNGVTLTDSLCIATGGAAVYAQPAASGNVVRNVTAIAASQHGIGLQADENGVGDTQVTASNSIFLGTQYDVESTATVGGSAEVTLDHSDFKTVQQGPGATITDAGLGNVSAAPKFVDERNADFNEAIGSPTIDAGSKTGIAAGDTDLAGRPRTLGKAPDIGAYEAIPTSKPTLSRLKVPAKHKHSLAVQVSVNPGHLATTVTFVATRNGHSHSVIKSVSGSGSRRVTATIRHLKRHKLYAVHVAARNSRGRVRSKTVAARTP